MFNFSKIPSPALLAITMTSPYTVMADDTNQQISQLSQQVSELQQQVNLLADHTNTPATQTQVGGYGELHYNNLTTRQNGTTLSEKKELDFHRFVLFINHQFDEKVRFFSELELEHSIAGEGQKGEVELEQAYIEMDLTPQTRLKAGILLQPIGILNETHEPNTFYGVERNPVEKNLIPATWWSGGIALSHQIGQTGKVDFLIGEGLKTSDGYSIRKGRQKTAKANANDLSYTVRLQFNPNPGFNIGGSVHYESNIAQSTLPNASDAMLLEGHLQYQKNQLGLKALYAQWQIQGSVAKNAHANRQIGFYIEPSYLVTEKIGLFTRYNQWNNSTTSDLEDTQVNIGINYWPHPNVVFKADYQWLNDGRVGSDKETNGFNLAVGYQF